MLWRHNFYPWRHQQNFILWLKLYCGCSHVTKGMVELALGNFYKSDCHNLNFIRIWPKKQLFEWCSWFKFNNLGLVLGIASKFYTSLAKGLKLKSESFWGLILTFVEVTEEKLVGGAFLPTSSWIGLTILKKI